MLSDEHVCIIEDNETDFLIIRQMLIEIGFTEGQLLWYKDLSSFSFQSEQYVLCDLNLPDSEGVDTLKSLLEIPGVEKATLVVLTGTNDETIAQETIQLGAQDYLVKGSFSKEYLRKTLLLSSERKRLIDDLLSAQQSLKMESKRVKRSNLEGLSSQLNPHFIFNAMSSIQHSILLKDTEESIIFTSSFAKLMRSVLENSRKSLISWEDEEAFLSNYLELERMRLESSFDYAFILEDGLDPDNVYMPPMLIQPYLENTVVHGIGNLTDRKGQVTVSLRLVGELYEVSIEDNGVGRERALKLRTLRVGDEQVSRAMGINDQRIELLNDLYDSTEFSVEVVDLKGEDNSPQGTKVNILIPANLNF